MTKKFDVNLIGNDTLLNTYYTNLNTVENTDSIWLQSVLHQDCVRFMGGYAKYDFYYTYDSVANTHTMQKMVMTDYQNVEKTVMTNREGFFDRLLRFWQEDLFNQGSTVLKVQQLYHHMAETYFSRFQDLYQYVTYHLGKTVAYRWEAGSMKRHPSDVEAYFKLPYTMSSNIYTEHTLVNSIIGLIDRLHPHQVTEAEISVNALHIESGLNINLWRALSTHLKQHGNDLVSFIPIIETFVLDGVNVEAKYHSALTAVTAFTSSTHEAKTTQTQEFRWTDDNGKEHLVHTSIADLLWILSELSLKIQQGTDVDLNKQMLKPLIHHVLHQILLQSDEDLLRGLILHFAPTLTSDEVNRLLHEYVISRR